MKKVTLFLLGFIPLALGFIMNSWMMKNQNSILPFKLIGVIFLLFWIFLGLKTSEFEETPVKSAIIGNSPAILMLLLIMFQEIILGRFLLNMVGIVSQFYFLPLINLSSSIVGVFLFLTPFPIEMWSSSLIAFLLMFGSYYFGGYLKRKQG